MTQDLDSHRTPNGFADLVDYRLVRWEEGLAEIALTVSPQHLNRSGFLHGGVAATILDAACGYTGCFAEDRAKARRAVTLSLNTHFITAARPGDRLICRAKKTGGGATVFFAVGEVLDQAERLIARGEGVFKYRGLRGDSRSA